MRRLQDIAPKLVALDIEGDGDRKIRPIEIGLVEIWPETGKSWSTLLRTPNKISWYATKIHKLRNGDLKDAPVAEEVWPELRALLEGAVVVGHGIRQDLKCLQRAFPELPRFEVIDTLPMSRQLLPGLPGYSLGVLAEALGVQAQHAGRGPHSALYDASIGAGVFMHMCTLENADAYLKGAGFKKRRADVEDPDPEPSLTL